MATYQLLRRRTFQDIFITRANGMLGLLLAASLTVHHPTATRVETSIRQHGAAATIARLWGKGGWPSQWDWVIDRMGDGNAGWIALAPKLAPGSDAGSSEDLGIALAFALPKNPRAVLAALDLGNGIVLGADRVCGAPFIEDTVKDIPAYRRRAIRAVKAVSNPHLKMAKTACLTALRAP